MALVTYVLGDCRKCGAKDSFGNVEVFKTYIYLGCKHCRYSERVELPPLKKKILYLDQFFFSHAFRGGDSRFLEAASRISRVASLQLLAVPFSSIHEDETHQWAKHKELLEFIKRTSRGNEFAPSYEVIETQLLKAFQLWLVGGTAQYELDQGDVLHEDIHVWDSYLYIDVGKYMGDIDLIRDLKRQSVEGLVNLFDVWHKSRTSFEEDLDAEYAVAGKTYIDFYLEYVTRIGRGDYDALLDSPVISMVVQSMLYAIPKDVPVDQKLRKCVDFLMSEHFKQVPYQRLSALLFATMKAVVKGGAYSNRERAKQRLSGFYYDVKHIATYAPYVDGFIMDQPMADLVSKPSVALEQNYGTKVFSLNNWDELYEWLDTLEAGMSVEHKSGLVAAYKR